MTGVAVVGGGIFGVTTALELDRAGHDVDLFEQSGALLTAASRGNQGRLHRGYHYPRSESTARSCRASVAQFREYYPGAVVEGADHYYCIASERTKTTGEEFLAFCDRLGLEYERADPGLVDRDRIDVSVRVPESRLDHHALRERCERDLAASDVRVHLETRVTDLGALDHEYAVVATYAGINDLLDDHGALTERCKFELCEKPVARLPPSFRETSVVVMDGPFMCVDPYGRTGDFLLGNVVHAVHERSVGERFDVDERYEPYLDAGVVDPGPLSNFDAFVESGREFVPGLARAEHVGSLFTVRTVLAGVEDTDERPTLVDREGNVFRLLSGKIAACVPAAREVVERIDGD